MTPRFSYRHEHRAAISKFGRFLLADKQYATYGDRVTADKQCQSASVNERGSWVIIKLRRKIPKQGRCSTDRLLMQESYERVRQVAPSAERNVGPILEVLRHHLPSSGRVLEVASGTGQHVVAFAGAFLNVQWLPSDPRPEARDSIEAWISHSACANVQLPLDLDVSRESWESDVGGMVDAIIAINLLHISPWRVTLGLLRGAANVLRPGGTLFIYGCFKKSGKHLSDSNVQFDASLRQRNPEWGVRDIEDVTAEGESKRLIAVDVVEMPTNNLSLILLKQ